MPMFRKDKKRLPSESRLPNLNVESLGPVRISESDRAATEKSLKPLWLEMSRRRLLTDEGADEDVTAMQTSAETLIQHVHAARVALPKDSPVDALLEDLQDACNRFRTEVQNRGWQDYRIILRSLREDIQAIVFQVNDLVPLDVGRRLANKIDPASAELGFMTFAPGPDGTKPPEVIE
jgi:hypothetical protein